MEYDVGEIVLDGWRIVRKIGQGAFSSVYEIQDLTGETQAPSALKVIHIPRSEEELRCICEGGMDRNSILKYIQSSVEDIVMEIKAMSALKTDPYIVHYEDHDVRKHPDGIRWDVLIRMELLTPLTEYAMKYGLSAADVVRLGIEISRALSSCHARGFAHCDLKPENILVDDCGHFKLADFGTVRAIEKTLDGSRLRGTPEYLAPEVYNKRMYDVRADIYSLGLVLYKCFNHNKLPFETQNETAQSALSASMLRRMQGDELPRIEGVDRELNDIIRKACAFKPEDRYDSADEFGWALICYEQETCRREAERREISFPPEQEAEIQCVYASPEIMSQSQYEDNSRGQSFAEYPLNYRMENGWVGETLMICPNCGEGISTSVTVCPYCKTILRRKGNNQFVESRFTTLYASPEIMSQSQFEDNSRGQPLAEYPLNYQTENEWDGDTLTTCPNCGEGVSTRATICPYCKTVLKRSGSDRPAESRFTTIYDSPAIEPAACNIVYASPEPASPEPILKQGLRAKMEKMIMSLRKKDEDDEQ